MAAKSTKRKTSTKGKSKKKQENTVLHGEIIILGVLAVCIFLLISNFGLGGLIGDIFSALMFGLFGWMAYPLPLLIFGVTAFLISNRGNTHAYIKAAAVVMFSILLTAFLELLINSYEPGTTVLEYYRRASIGKEAGGVLGGCPDFLTLSGDRCCRNICDLDSSYADQYHFNHREIAVKATST